jgi:hypothetical protein
MGKDGARWANEDESIAVRGSRPVRTVTQQLPPRLARAEGESRSSWKDEKRLDLPRHLTCPVPTAPWATGGALACFFSSRGSRFCHFYAGHGFAATLKPSPLALAAWDAGPQSLRWVRALAGS